jgi:hypothetical protein
MLGNRVARPQPETQGSTKEGLVYLIQSGPHYKIGRSDELERRVKQIRVALPEAATLVHSIRTEPCTKESVHCRRTHEGRIMWWRLDLFGMWDGVPLVYRYGFLILVLGGIVLLVTQSMDS